ncbi:MAG: HAD family hydrolase [Planctomycetota bacterium]
MRLDGIVFDLGNTLVPFGERELARVYDALEAVFRDALGPVPGLREHALGVRDALVTERETGSMREITVEEFADAVCGGRAPEALAGRLGEAMHRSFVDACRVPSALPELLERLAARHKLAVLSNFCLTPPVEEVLRRAGLSRHFEIVEVSATHGYMKPHASLFRRVLAALGTAPERTLMVGDNVWADVVGGRRAGMRTALTREFCRGPVEDPRAPGVKPDLVLERLDALAARP